MKRQIGTEKLLLIVCAAMIVCVAILTFMAVGLKESGVEPEETAISATVEFRGYVFELQDGSIFDKIMISSADKGISIKAFRELEEQVKNSTLKTYTESIVWDAIFTYKNKDGTEETYTYKKTQENKAVTKFADQYFEGKEEDNKGIHR